MLRIGRKKLSLLIVFVLEGVLHVAQEHINLGEHLGFVLCQDVLGSERLKCFQRGALS